MRKYSGGFLRLPGGILKACAASQSNQPQGPEFDVGAWSTLIKWNKNPGWVTGWGFYWANLDST
jgi:hypothetical protein